MTVDCFIYLTVLFTRAENSAASGPAQTDSSPLGSECHVKGLSKPRYIRLAAATKIEAKARAQKKASRAKEKAASQSQKTLYKVIAKASKQLVSAKRNKMKPSEASLLGVDMDKLDPSKQIGSCSPPRIWSPEALSKQGENIDLTIPSGPSTSQDCLRPP